MSIAALVAIFTLFLVLFVRKRFSRLPLPPGPPGYPLLGNVAGKNIVSSRKLSEAVDQTNEKRNLTSSTGENFQNIELVGVRLQVPKSEWHAR